MGTSGPECPSRAEPSRASSGRLLLAGVFVHGCDSPCEAHCVSIKDLSVALSPVFALVGAFGATWLQARFRERRERAARLMELLIAVYADAFVFESIDCFD